MPAKAPKTNEPRMVASSATALELRMPMGDAQHPRSSRPAATQQAVAEPEQILNSFESQIGCYAGEVRRAHHRAGDARDRCVLQAHRDRSHTPDQQCMGVGNVKRRIEPQGKCDHAEKQCLDGQGKDVFGCRPATRADSVITADAIAPMRNETQSEPKAMMPLRALRRPTWPATSRSRSCSRQTRRRPRTSRHWCSRPPTTG